MADDLRSTLEAAVADAEKQNAAAPAPAPAPSTQTPALFKSPEVKDPGPTHDSTTLVPEKVEKQEPSPQNSEPPKGKDPAEVTETDVEKQEPEAKAPVNVDRAPQSWKPAEKAKWATIDPTVRGEIVRREREVSKALQDAAGARNFAQGFEKAVQPYIGRYQQMGLAPTKVIQNLMQADHLLATAPAPQKAQLMAQLINDYGIDIEQLAAAIDKAPAPQPAGDAAAVEAILAQKLAPIQQFIEGQTRAQQEAAAREQQKLQETVDAMEQDARYPLFSMVREDMADIIEINSRKGRAITLGEAYNRAVQMNPEASKEAAEMAKREQAQKANETAQRSLGASLSVTGSPSQVKTPVPANDLRGTLEAAVAAAMGR